MKTLFKNKKGFTLAECVVALFLFSVITGSVLTVFSVSQNRIKNENDNHKLDILTSNILTAYEASEEIGDFKRIAGRLGIAIDIDETPHADATVSLGGGSGAGSIPVKVPYDYISVNNRQAVFYAKNGENYTPVFSFDGNYEKNKLTEGDNGDIPSGKYDKKNISQMVICGGIQTKLGVGLNPHYYKCTFTKNDITGERSIKFQIDKNLTALNKIDFNNVNNWASFTVTSLSDFEEYLLDNGYYLMWEKAGSHENKNEPTRYRKEKKIGKLVIGYDYSDTPKSGYEACEWKKYTDYYFQVYDATKTGSDNTAPLPLYYCITVANNTVDALIQCQTQIDKAADGDGNPEKMIFALANAKITFAAKNSCPDYSEFTNVLKNDNGAEFTGNWHFLPWVFYRSYDNSNRHLENAKNTMFSYSYGNRNEYYPTDAYKDIYYILEKDNKMDLMNADGDRMFSFDATGKTNPLSAADCKFKNIELTKAYKGEDWNLYYQKGSMPLKTFAEIKAEGNVITVYSKEGDANQPFIRFVYKNGKQPDGIPQNPPTGGYIYFACDKFDGEYTVKVIPTDKLFVGESATPEDLVEAINDVGIDDTIEGVYKFTSTANDFEIIGAVPNSELSCGVIGQPYGGDVESNTYYITCGLDDIARQLLVRVTFTDLAKVKKKDENYIEPRIDVWSVDEGKIHGGESLEALQNLIAGTDVRLEYSYRKG